MKQAGYVQLNRRPVLGEDGAPLDILELHICRTRLCIRLQEIRAAVSNGSIVPVEKLKWNWMAYTGGLAGTARVSKSGRALNIDLSNGERFTLALDALHAVMSCRERYATVAVIPSRIQISGIRNRLITDYTGTLPGECPGRGAASPPESPVQVPLIACET